MGSIFLLSLLTFVSNTLCGSILYSPIQTVDINNNYQLDGSVIPSHYDVDIKAYMLESHGPEKLFTFDGSSEITISTNQENIDRIVLHMCNLSISKTELLDQISGENLPVHLVEPNNTTEQLTIKLDRPLRINRQYILSFVYSGKVGDATREGIYRQSYDSDSGETLSQVGKLGLESGDTSHLMCCQTFDIGKRLYIYRWYVATYFQPGYARAAFPCFDEPRFKATFAFRINRENEYSSASNTLIDFKVPLESEGRTIDVYKKSPIMSTYLVAFLISNLGRLESEHKNFTILVRPELIEKTRVALDFGIQVLQELDDYTGIPYMSMQGLKKLDFVALPGFPGGMEHWGIINFAEMFLHVWDGYNNGGLSQYCYELIAHEVAHQWFGNLVTCSWWTHIWLNEGFANYFSYLVGKKLYTNFDWEYYFAMHNVRPILLADSLPTAFAISGRKLETIPEIKEMFGKLSYRKGATIIRMMAHMLGEDAFRKAIQSYLQNNAYNSVTPQQLGDALNEYWNNDAVDIHEFLSDWATQSGCPTVVVHLNEDGRSIKVTQKQYVSEGPDVNSTKQWIIPFTFTTNIEMNFQNLTPRVYIKKNTEQVIQLDHKADWVIGNIQQSGLYRVHYDDENWKNLANALYAPDQSGIHKINVEQLMDDAMSLFELKLIKFSTMAIIKNLKLNETYGAPDVITGSDPTVGNEKSDSKFDGEYPSVSKINEQLKKLPKENVEELLNHFRNKYVVE